MSAELLLFLAPPMLEVGKLRHSVDVELTAVGKRVQVRLLRPDIIKAKMPARLRVLAETTIDADDHAGLTTWLELVGPAVGAKLDAKARNRT